MAENISKNDLDVLINLVKKHSSRPALLEKLQALRDTYYLYPDVWVSTVGFRQGQPVEMRADVMHMTNEDFDKLMDLDEEDD